MSFSRLRAPLIDVTKSLKRVERENATEIGGNTGIKHEGTKTRRPTCFMARFEKSALWICFFKWKTQKWPSCDVPRARLGAFEPWWLILCFHAAAYSAIWPWLSIWSNLTETRLLTPCSCMVTP